MSFSSHITKKEVIINDSYNALYDDPLNAIKGLQLNDRGEGFAYDGYAKPFPDELLIPKHEWQARIQEMEEEKSRLSDIIRLGDLPHKDQANTNYCWINAPTHCVEILRLKQNQRKVILSPASAGAQIKQYKNVGGWGLEGLKWIVDHGLAPIQYWPANAIDRKYATEENRLIAKRYRVIEWLECRPRSVEQMVSMLLRRIPGAGGYNWWRHEVTLVDPLWLDGDIAIRIRNSWPNWGDFGFGVLQGSKILADDLVFPLNTMAS